MPLTIIRGSNQSLLLYAIRHRPSLIIDCNNCADPHTIYKHATLEEFENVYVIEVELLYAFRDVLKALPRFIHELKVSCVVITAFHYLINYHNKHENKEVARHCFEIIESLSKNHNIILGMQDGTHSQEPENCIGFVIR